MKRFFTILVAIFFAMPTFASCSIDSNEPCTASALDDQNKTLQDKFTPHPLEELKKTDAFQPQYRQPYYDELIKTTPPVQSPTSTTNYNSNCQFGVCLPGVEPAEDNFID